MRIEKIKKRKREIFEGYATECCMLKNYPKKYIEYVRERMKGRSGRIFEFVKRQHKRQENALLNGYKILITI